METEWGTVLNPRVRVLKPGAEAVVSCILKDSDGEKDRYRFWTVRDKAALKIYDFESVSDGVRLSILLTSILNDAEGDPRKLAAITRAATVFHGITAQLAAGETAKVLEALQTLDLENLPKTLAAIFEMIEGAVLIAEGQEEKALEVLDRCLTHRPDLPRALRLKSEVCLSLRRFDDVVRAEREYLKIIVDDPDAFFNIGNAFRELKKVDEAIEAHRKGADCDPEDAPNRLRLGILLAGRGRPVEAKKHLVDAFNRSDDAAEAYTEAAGEIMKTDAMELLRDLAAGQAKEQEEDAGPLYHQGHALRRLGSHEEARKTLARARELDKDELFSSELLEELACTLVHLVLG